MQPRWPRRSRGRSNPRSLLFRQPDGLRRVLLTGGSIAMAAYRALDANAVDWANVEFWFGDERFVGIDLPDRNDGQARDAFLDRVGATRVHSLADNDCSLSAADAARAYAETLPTRAIRPDAARRRPRRPHRVALSRLPAAPRGRSLAAAVFDSPKPPPVRVTLTFPALTNSDTVMFIVAGDDKADAVARALADEGTIDETPARGVEGINETIWFVDKPAARHLENQAE